MAKQDPEPRCHAAGGDPDGNVWAFNEPQARDSLLCERHGVQLEASGRWGLTPLDPVVVARETLRDRYLEMADRGLSQSAAARELGVAQGVVGRNARRMGVKFKDGRSARAGARH